jgi:hypothetical protein
MGAKVSIDPFFVVMFEASNKLILGVILSNVVLIWLVCWPFRFQVQERRKWSFSLFKLVCVICVVSFDLLIGYALGKALRF